MQRLTKRNPTVDCILIQNKHHLTVLKLSDYFKGFSEDHSSYRLHYNTQLHKRSTTDIQFLHIFFLLFRESAHARYYSVFWRMIYG